MTDHALDQDLWQRAGAGDEAARHELVEQHIGLVYEAARRLAIKLSDSVEFDDLVSAGSLGLVKALDGFEPERGLAFSTYAMPRIRGAMLDDLRSKDRATRSVRKREREIREARRRLGQRLGRPPSDHEVAEAMGIDVEEVWTLKDRIRATKPMEIDRQVGEEGSEGATLGEVLADREVEDPTESLLREERREALKAAIAELKPQERLVLSLYYYEELKQVEIADVLNVTESRISQIRSKAVGRLKERFAAPVS